MDAWTTLVLGSSAPSSSDAWVLLNNLEGTGGGFITIPVLSEISIEIPFEQSISVETAALIEIDVIVPEDDISIAATNIEVDINSPTNYIDITEC
jgi:hypothetical protein